MNKHDINAPAPFDEYSKLLVVLGELAALSELAEMAYPAVLNVVVDTFWVFASA